MKIALCINDLTGGGAESQSEYLSKGLADRGMVITVYYLRNGPGVFKRSENVRYHNVNSRNKLQVFNLLFQILRREDYSAVITCSLYFDILVAVCSWFQNFTHFIRESNSKKGRKKTIKNFVRLKINKKAVIISNNISGQQMWRENGNNAYFVRNGYKFPKVSAKKQKIVVVGGRFIQRKRIEAAIEYFFNTKFFENYNLQIIGDGPEKKNSLRKLTKFEAKEERWTYNGFVSRDDLQKLFSRSAYFISLSEYEGTPNIVIEALAQDCSVILSDVECHRQYFPSNIVYYEDLEDRSESNLYQHSPNSIDVKEFVNGWSESKMVSEYMRIIALIP